ncbi:hypothetical protein Acr_26g0007670 [Actinidia rufa]|uniref:Uncharacterized protein n=1 Tax=Actinidia rufa TaxID=165716 RepID=A0A7J0H330_9ERIC|nr:hypothetical protein Acr_26g0007670 [Actinidia rufa]
MGRGLMSPPMPHPTTLAEIWSFPTLSQRLMELGKRYPWPTPKLSAHMLELALVANKLPEEMGVYEHGLAFIMVAAAASESTNKKVILNGLAVARQASGCSEELLRALDLDLGRIFAKTLCLLIQSGMFEILSLRPTPGETASIHVPSLKEAFAIIQNEESRNGVMLPPIASKQSALISIPQFDDLVTLGRLAGVSIVDLLLENEVVVQGLQVVMVAILVLIILQNIDWFANDIGIFICQADGGQMEKSSITRDFPIAKAAYSFLKDNVSSSFCFPGWNKGRVVCQRTQLKRILSATKLSSEGSKKDKLITLSNSSFPFWGLEHREVMSGEIKMEVLILKQELE